ncbi:hypothetical protein [Baekduia sp. Peel2402]|uniref:hypothetical protein n=1 Tax=Baekduia sp. Peel2402 TaxID=3458296 RepID=UPI00403E5D3C
MEPLLINDALRHATAHPLDRAVVAGCLDLSDPVDARFHRAWTGSLAALPRHERGGALAGVTGHVAESVASILLVDAGCELLWQFSGPGRHGVDLVVLTPGERVVGVEVKGTLRPRHSPRISRRAVLQMSSAWIDKADNPGMASLQLTSDDIHGAVITMNFADMVVRAAATSNFAAFAPLPGLDSLDD